ncbi:LOG family protein [Nocardioides marmorisolisilvae]|uniref:LOG family protein n=1 Tax=Nocardioides marmorisolisilvae TaxID=1542737 RepID=UPI001FE9390A|nr:LOG family protein [Nocardioides marmorisolisilvae]
MRIKELETLDAFDEALADGLHKLRGYHLQSLDLTGRARELSGINVAGGVFLGCRFAPGEGPGTEIDVRRRGGLVFPTVPDVPFDPYRARLYSPDELYAGLEDGYSATPDAIAYAWSLQPRAVDRTLAAALHDHAIDDALEEFVEGRELVGVLGGHALARDEPGYREAAVLGRELATQFTVATGGGPGAMEAANLGAWMAGHDESALDEAIAVLAAAPHFADDLSAWARAAFTVRERWAHPRRDPSADQQPGPNGRDSLGIPTWFYGHEPPNPLASVIAKYFSNATREDVLLKVCRRGLVFLPGAAGTVQEIFQAACANYYAQAPSVVPMVLVGVEHWTREVGVWELLRSLGADRAFGARLDLVDSTAEVLPLLAQRRGDLG